MKSNPLYPDTDEETPEGGDAAEQESDKPGTETTLVPASIFPEPPEPGKTCTFKVVAVHDGEVEVEYSKSKEPEPATEPGEMSIAEAMMSGGE